MSFLIALSHHANPLSTLFRYIFRFAPSLLVRRPSAGQCTPSFFRQKRFNRKAPLSIGFLFSSTQPSRSSPTPTPHNMILFNLSAKDPPPRGGARHAPASRIHKRALSLLRPFRSDIFLELLQKSLQDYANAAMSFKITYFWSKTTFSRFVLHCFYFLSFLPKKCVFCAKNALFRSLFCVCCVLQKTAPKRAAFVFLCLFVFVCDNLFNETLQRKHR